MSHIEVIALRSFPWSEDGYTEIQAVEKSTFLLPERLFSGLNKIGYVRRAAIGDGHFKLTPPQDPGKEPAKEASVSEASEGAQGDAVDTGVVSTKAPQPPVRTAELTDDEKAALADGSWKEWRFFKARSVAAKISDQPVNDGATATAVIEAHITKE